jgi:dipeptidyl aminopeptidase/acylaminoacyl peptidase
MSNEFNELSVASSLDGSIEKNLFYYLGNGTNIPLVVALHSWSAERSNQQCLLEFCVKRGWALLLPEFRGPNIDSNPRVTQACGSTLARQDIIDAVDYVGTNYSIDTEHIFLLGGSGGGHMALMMAAYRPELWAAVSAWCPITDLVKWHQFYGDGNSYALHIESCCGGTPGASDAVDLEYQTRSPISYLDELMKAKLFIHHGRMDVLVPYSHTLDLVLQLEAMGHERLFFEIFDGTHEMRAEAGFCWFDALYNESTQQELTG